MNDPDSRFAFFLGAGCSISSGIPGAGTLVRNWLPKLKKLRTGSEDNLEEWVKKEFPKYDGDNPALLYGEVIEKLFLTPQERQREIERLIEEKDPGFGYAVLAQIISNRDYGRHFNVVLSTNFDDMVADALYLYTNKKPLVISHDSLIGFVKISRTRPLVIKLHGDARLTPRNTTLETKELNDAVKKVLSNLLLETGLIFIGYGANDKSIANILDELPKDALPWGIYWVHNDMPKSDIGKWLENRKGVWVKHLDFDELMLLIWSQFELKEPDWKRFDKLSTSYLESFKKLQDKVKTQPDPNKKTILEEAVQKAVSKSESWWSVALEADKYAKTDSEKADQIYQEGLRTFTSDANLLDSYAVFLYNIRKDYDKAEEYYERAVEADPKHAVNLGNYALLLDNIRKDYDKAEEYYKRAVEANPNNAINLGSYAVFLYNIHKDYDKAEEYYKRAIEADPNNAINLGNYALLLENIRKNYEGAQRYNNRTKSLTT